jgi:hypothetical protein
LDDRWQHLKETTAAFFMVEKRLSYVSTKLLGVTFKNTTIFIFAVLKTSNVIVDKHINYQEEYP